MLGFQITSINTGIFNFNALLQVVKWLDFNFPVLKPLYTCIYTYIAQVVNLTNSVGCGLSNEYAPYQISMLGIVYSMHYYNTYCYMYC